MAGLTKRKERALVIVPAYNEEGYMEHSLPALVKWRDRDSKKNGLVVVDDGSTDRTAQIAKEMGVEVIKSHPKGKNIGKGGAVKRGVIKAFKEGYGIVVTHDADLEKLTANHPERLIRDLIEGEHTMVVGKIKRRETGGDVYFHQHSGQRAFRTDSFKPWIIAKNPKWEERLSGYGFEKGTDYYMRNKIGLSEVTFQVDGMKRKGLKGRSMNKEVGGVEADLHKMRKKAEKLRAKRRHK